MSSSRLRIVVTGLIAQYPLGGVAWDYLQYPLGLVRLGHDVYYVEDTGQWPYNPSADGVSPTCDFNVSYLREIMERFGLADRWAYRFAWNNQWFGMNERQALGIVESADLVLNVSGVLRDATALQAHGTLVYVDTDPVFTQAKYAKGQREVRRTIDIHHRHFSFGELLADTPVTGHEWLPTRQPIVLSEWGPHPDGHKRFTTVMNWNSYNDVEYQGRRLGQKDVEFVKFLELPSMTTAELEIAVASGKNVAAPIEQLKRHGWSIVDPRTACPDVDSYRTYISRSQGEWSVAKHGYVAGRSGWFSCRSACYLACGRPVVAQDTGYSTVLPTGNGLLPFSTLEEARAAIEAVIMDPAQHSIAARDIAAAYFDADLVLPALIQDALTTTVKVGTS